MTGSAADSRFQVAFALHQAGRIEEAATAYAAILAASPRHVDALLLFGVLEGQRGRPAEAERLFAGALAADPRSLMAASNRSIMLRTLGRLDEALASCELALAIDGTDVPSLGHRGHLLLALGRGIEAARAARRLLALAPSDTIGLLIQARVLADAGRLDEARSGYGRALAVRADLPEAWSGRGLAQLARRDPGRALPDFARALALQPSDATTMMNRANALRRAERAGDALSSFARALAVRPDHAETFYNRSLAFRDLHRLDDAIAEGRRALALKPDLVEALVSAGGHFLAIGARRQAFLAYERAACLAPSWPDLWRSRLSVRLYEDRDPRGFCDLARTLTSRMAPIASRLPFGNDRDPDRRLRVGFLSSDFHSHPTARNFLPAFACRDRNAVEYICYAHERRRDPVADWFRGNADAWRAVQHLTDEEVAALVRRDRVDVLVFLAALLDQNRPMVAAWRAAPVQISLGDAATSGVREMDYFVGDPILIPEDGREEFVETPVRIRFLYNHEPRTSLPIAPRQSPAEGAATFGSFNNPIKLTPTTLRLWDRVLARLPDARLVLKYRADFARPWLQAEILKEMTPAVADRVSFVIADETEEQHLARYGEIDIALDSYPFNGATTTYESLWMGVPVVTLAGETYISRMTAEHLIAVGLPELVAYSEDDFVEIAVGLARDPARLGALRASLRDRLLASPLTDGAGFARDLETLLRDLWRRWATRV